MAKKVVLGRRPKSKNPYQLEIFGDYFAGSNAPKYGIITGKAVTKTKFKADNDYTFEFLGSKKIFKGTDTDTIFLSFKISSVGLARGKSRIGNLIFIGSNQKDENISIKSLVLDETTEELRYYIPSAPSFVRIEHDDTTVNADYSVVWGKSTIDNYYGDQIYGYGIYEAKTHYINNLTDEKINLIDTVTDIPYGGYKLPIKDDDKEKVSYIVRALASSTTREPHQSASSIVDGAKKVILPDFNVDFNIEFPIYNFGRGDVNPADFGTKWHKGQLNLTGFKWYNSDTGEMEPSDRNLIIQNYYTGNNIRHKEPQVQGISIKNLVVPTIKTENLIYRYQIQINSWIELPQGDESQAGIPLQNGKSRFSTNHMYIQEKKKYKVLDDGTITDELVWDYDAYNNEYSINNIQYILNSSWRLLMDRENIQNIGNNIDVPLSIYDNSKGFCFKKIGTKDAPIYQIKEEVHPFENLYTADLTVRIGTFASLTDFEPLAVTERHAIIIIDDRRVMTYRNYYEVLAKAIQEKTGTSASMMPWMMPHLIRDIETLDGLLYDENGNFLNQNSFNGEVDNGFDKMERMLKTFIGNKIPENNPNFSMAAWTGGLAKTTNQSQWSAMSNLSEVNYLFYYNQSSFPSSGYCTVMTKATLSGMAGCKTPFLYAYIPATTSITANCSNSSVTTLFLPGIERLSGGSTSGSARLRFTKVNYLSMPVLKTAQQNCFYSMPVLTNLYAPMLNTIGINAFTGTVLTSATFMNVTSIGRGAFSNVTALTQVELNGFAKLPSDTFNGCTGLSEVVLGETINEIELNAFKGCEGSSLRLVLNSPTVVSLSNSVTSSTTTLYATIPSLTTIVVPATVQSLYEVAPYWSDYFKN